MNISNLKFQILNLCLSVFICGCIFGCHAQPKQQIVGYYGETDPINKVVADVNHNSEQISTLRGAGQFEAWINDQKKTNYVNGQITMLYQRPALMRLVGKKDIAGTIFELGSNEERYWVIIGGGQDTMWTGTWKNIDKVDPKQIPIRPDLMLEVLGVQSINTNLLEQPVPVMRFNNDTDAYMLVWNVKLQDRWVAQKEIWYDRETKLPKLVNLYDENGRVVLRAYLSDHKPLEVSGVPEQQWPKVATKYRLFFPPNQSKMNIDLDDVALKRNNAPNERSFTYPGDRAGVSRVIDLDEQPAQ
jgi:hypothetical protein